MRWRRRPIRLARVLMAHARDEADRATLTCVKPWTGAVIWYCPTCESRLEDSVGGWWCVTCETGFSEAFLAAADPESGAGF